MRMSVIWWELDFSEQTIDTLNDHLTAEGIAAWAEVANLHEKYWIADPERNRWGAVMVWDSEPAAEQAMPPNRASELIGFPPTHRLSFDVVAMTCPGQAIWRPL